MGVTETQGCRALSGQELEWNEAPCRLAGRHCCLPDMWPHPTCETTGGEGGGQVPGFPDDVPDFQDFLMVSLYRQGLHVPFYIIFYCIVLYSSPVSHSNVTMHQIHFY